MRDLPLDEIAKWCLAWSFRYRLGIRLERIPRPIPICRGMMNWPLRRGKNDLPHSCLNGDRLSRTFLGADLATNAGGNLYRSCHHGWFVCGPIGNGRGRRARQALGAGHIQAAYGTQIHTDATV